MAIVAKPKIITTVKVACKDRDARDRFCWHCGMLSMSLAITIIASLLFSADVAAMLSPLPMYGQEFKDLLKKW